MVRETKNEHPVLHAETQTATQTSTLYICMEQKTISNRTICRTSRLATFRRETKAILRYPKDVCHSSNADSNSFKAKKALLHLISLTKLQECYLTSAYIYLEAPEIKARSYLQRINVSQGLRKSEGS